MKLEVFTENMVGSPLEHDYDLLIHGTYLQLCYSDNEEWSTPGEVCAALLDDGNGIRLSLEGMSTDISLEYHQAHQLLILLSQENTTRTEIREPAKVIKTV